MPKKFARMTKTKKISLGMVAAGAAVMAGTVVSAPAASAATPTQSGGNVDTWINQALEVMHKKGIPGTYEGIRKNLMRESSGNPNAINNWDSNAVKGIPSKGLMQVIDPTFNTYHVAGTSTNIYDPVANITASANYAAHRYGSIDNVNSAY
ncbi:transglycosylase SLT domain-containing protein [Streptomyces sp. NPDC005262]|uniref:transglycosylase SLT domain-containing protein n=1 Tax=Streptomyces sp. NPDC005262 TaxID=3364710 RepID=UPI0036C05B46